MRGAWRKFERSDWGGGAVGLDGEMLDQLHLVLARPKEQVQNGEERLVVHNRVAKSVAESLRGLHLTHVFVSVPKEGEAGAYEADEQHCMEARP